MSLLDPVKCVFNVIDDYQLSTVTHAQVYIRDSAKGSSIINLMLYWMFIPLLFLTCLIAKVTAVVIISVSLAIATTTLLVPLLLTEAVFKLFKKAC